MCGVVCVGERCARVGGEGVSQVSCPERSFLSRTRSRRVRRAFARRLRPCVQCSDSFQPGTLCPDRLREVPVPQLTSSLALPADIETARVDMPSDPLVVDVVQPLRYSSDPCCGFSLARDASSPHPSLPTVEPLSFVTIPLSDRADTQLASSLLTTEARIPHRSDSARSAPFIRTFSLSSPSSDLIVSCPPVGPTVGTDSEPLSTPLP